VIIAADRLVPAWTRDVHYDDLIFTAVPHRINGIVERYTESVVPQMTARHFVADR
jgi:hypothetical protein